MAHICHVEQCIVAGGYVMEGVIEAHDVVSENN
jgi:hypothetical protein